MALFKVNKVCCPNCSGNQFGGKNIMLETFNEIFDDFSNAQFFCEYCHTLYHKSIFVNTVSGENQRKYFNKILSGTLGARLTKNFPHPFREVYFKVNDGEPEFRPFVVGQEGYHGQVFDVLKAGDQVRVFKKYEETEYLQELKNTFEPRPFIVPGQGLVNYKKKVYDGEHFVENKPLPEGSKPALIVCFPQTYWQSYVFVIPEEFVRIEH